MRLGLAEPGADAGPWKLLYCHARHAGEEKDVKLALHGDLYGEFLGPVFFSPDARAEAAGKMEGRWTLPAEGLYCALVLTAWEGMKTVSVMSSDGKVLARCCFPNKRNMSWAAARPPARPKKNRGGWKP